jgi:hypothetical protein
MRLLALALLLPACPATDSGRSAGPATRSAPGATRGTILISIDTLRADHLGAYGYGRDTSPGFDRLARQGTLFENAIVPLPGTLPSHMSLFTGLYPAQHNVYPPSAVLSPTIETLPEAFQRSGFRTAGFTEGGYMAGRYGFARGFERFSDAASRGPRAAEETFRRGAEFLAELGEGERFFLFLHTYAVHDPYDPPEPYRSLYWSGPSLATFPPTGPNLTAVNRGTRDLSPEALAYFMALYDGGINYLDGVLEAFVRELDALGLREQTTLVITSDHGEEFRDHGMLVHEQIHRENLRVPLLILHPEASRGTRVASLVQNIDIPPTLYELAGIPVEGAIPGRSLAPCLVDPACVPRTEAYAESFMDRAQTLFHASEGGLHQLIERFPEESGRTVWFGRSLAFDASASPFEFQLKSFHRPRTLEISIDGRPQPPIEVGTDWQTVSLELPVGGSKHRVALSSRTCDQPSKVGEGKDTRCHAFVAQGLDLARTELYELRADPTSASDLSAHDGAVAQELKARLREYDLEPVAPAEDEELEPDLEDQLEALGYVTQKTNAADEEYRLVLGDPLPAAVTVPPGFETAPDTSSGGAVVFRGSVEKTNSGGRTNGISVELPEAIEAQASGRAVQVTVVAKQAGDTRQRFAVAYSTNGVGNSGWRKFRASKQFQEYSFVYDVPPQKRGNGDFLGILPDYSRRGSGLVVHAISVRPVDRSGEG